MFGHRGTAHPRIARILPPMTHVARLLALVVAVTACTAAPLASVALPDASLTHDASLVVDAIVIDAIARDAVVVDAIARDAGLTHDGAPPDATSLDRCRAGAIEDCAYAPGVDYRGRTPVALSLSYDDVSGAERTVEIALHRPEGAPSPAPVVVWSHGGADGIARASAIGNEWARVFTSAGYVFIAIAHIGRDDSSRSALCAAIGVAAADCATFKYLSWDRPHDLSRVLDWLEEPGGALAGSVDLSRIGGEVSRLDHRRERAPHDLRSRTRRLRTLCSRQRARSGALHDVPPVAAVGGARLPRRRAARGREGPRVSHVRCARDLVRGCDGVDGAVTKSTAHR